MINEFGGVPFSAGSVFGHRAWQIDKYGRLSSVSQGFTWKPGENVAVCNHMYRHNHTRAGDHPDYECGFWAYHTGENEHARSGHVLGIIEGYGTCTIGEKGFRAEKARIVALVGPKGRGRKRDWSYWWLEPIFWIPVAVALAGLTVWLIQTGRDESWWSGVITAMAVVSCVVAFIVTLMTALEERRFWPEKRKPGGKPDLKTIADWYGVPLYRWGWQAERKFPIEVPSVLTEAKILPTPETDPKFWER